MEWQLPLFSWLKSVVWRGLWIGFLAFLLGVFLARNQLNLNRETGLVVGYVAGGIVGGLAMLIRGLGLVRKISINDDSSGGITIWKGFSSTTLRTEEVSAVISLIGTTLWGGELILAGNLLVAEGRRWRIYSAEASGTLYRKLLEVSPYAWGFPMEGEIQPPQDVAESTHGNAPERVLGRLRLQLARVMASRLVGSAMTAAFAVGLALLLWFNGRINRTIIFLLVLLYSAFQQFRASLKVGQQIRQLSAAERRLSGFE